MGRFQRAATSVETFDSKWLILVAGMLYWLGPIGVARAAALGSERQTELSGALVAARHILANQAAG